MREAHKLAFVLISACVMSLATSHAIAEDPIIGPNRGAVAFSSMDLRGIGLTATVQITEQRTPGYVPVRLVITGIGVAPADKHLTFRFSTHPLGESPPGNGLVIDVPVTIAQGARRTSITRYLPKWSVGHCLDVSIYEESRLLEDSVMHFGKPVKMSPVLNPASGWTTRGIVLPANEFRREYELNWLFVGEQDQASLETMPAFNAIVSHSDDGSIQYDEGTLRDRSQSPLAHVGQANLPRDWRGYQSFDVIVLSSDGLTRLAQDQNAIQPLREWILQGGAAVVYNAASLRDVLNDWRFRHTTGTGETTTVKILKARRDRSLLTPTSRATRILADLRPRDAIMIDNKQQTAEEQLGRSSSKWIKQIGVQPAGAGLIVSIPSNDTGTNDGPNIPSHNHWQVVKRLISPRSSPMVRNDTEPLLGNVRFRRWTIPGVLQPPVYTFIVLLTAFVILVGPIAYWQTSKHGRSHLMFAIAPILAIITTLAMFGYGLVADGLGTRVRVRQLTWVDGKSGDAGERVRATYFAGIRPSDGLRFAGNGNVMRQTEDTEASWEELNGLPPTTLGSVIVRGDTQLFDSSFLPSREQRQFIVHAPKSGIGSVELLPGPTVGANPKLTNHLQFQLRTAIVRDGDDHYWRVGELNPGDTRECESLSPKAASKLLGKLYNDYRPIAEITAGRDRRRNRPQGLEPLNFIRIQMGINNPFASGLFETWLQTHLQTTGEIPRLHFVATADVSDEVLAIERAELVDSVRYLFGTLR